MFRYAGSKHGLGFTAVGIALAVVVLALAANVSCGKEDPSAKPPGTETASASPGTRTAEIQRAIADLGSADFSVREKASQALWKAGAEAEPALEKTVRETDDFEVVYRARQILQSFQVGIYADTPEEIVLLIGRVRMGNPNMRQFSVQRLKELGKTDLLRRLIAKETDPNVRDQLNQFLNGPAAPIYQRSSIRTRVRPVPRAPDAAETAAASAAPSGTIATFDGAERLLRDAGSDDSVRDYAALLLSRNKLDAAITQLRANLKATDAAGQRRLAWMLRAKGDLAGAVAAAKLVNDNGLVEDLLAEMADWKELAKIDAKADVDAVVAGPDGRNGSRGSWFSATWQARNRPATWRLRPP